MMLTISHRVRTDIRSIIIAEAGGRPKQITKLMNTNQFSLANRKQLADVVGNGDYNGLRSRVKRTLTEKRDTLKESLIKQYAEKKGAFKALALITAAKEKLKEQEKDLAKLGFVFYDDDDEDVRIANGDAGRILRKLIDEQVDKEVGTLDDLEARFDSVQVAMMTVASLEDADKLLKSVSSI
jgi:hypothetical protein